MVTPQSLGNDSSMLSTFSFFLDKFLAIPWKTSGLCYGSTAAKNMGSSINKNTLRLVWKLITLGRGGFQCKLKCSHSHLTS